jgi:hypothetical protein
MQKKIITDIVASTQLTEEKWLDMDLLADVEISSEDPAFPIEAALLPGLEQGWRASHPGQQRIRLLFKQPQKIHLIQLRFKEFLCSRTQEYILRISSNKGESFKDIIRQQWNFSPEAASIQEEEHFIDQSGVDIIELEIVPDISGFPVFATLDKLRIA